MDDNSCDSFSSTSTANNAEESLLPNDQHSETSVTRKKSIVWQHFTSASATSVKCNECGKILNRCTSSTSSLLRHMRSHQELVVEELSQASTEVKKLDRNSDRAKELTDALAKMMAWDLAPFNIVDHRGFRHFANIAVPEFELPSRTTFSREIIPRMYNSEKDRLKQEIRKDIDEGVSTLALTTDGWTSRSVDSYISLTVHYVTKDFKAKTFMVAMVPIIESHTSKNLNDILRGIIAEWEFECESIRSVFFTTDNAPNIVAAIKLSPNWLRIPCFAHTLQLAVKDATKKSPEFSDCFKKAKSIVGFFSRSTTAHAKLMKAQQDLAPERNTLKLIQNVDTRWNSEYDMMARLLALRKALSIVLCDKGMPVAFTNIEWECIEKYVETLECVKEATVMMSSEAQPTLSQYMPIVEMMKKTIAMEVKEHTAEEAVDDTIEDAENDTAEIATANKEDIEEDLATLLHLSLCRRFEFVDPRNDAIVFAMILDPRYKDRLIDTEDQKQESTNRLCCKALLESLPIISSSSSEQIPTASCSLREESGEPKSKLQKMFDSALQAENNELHDIERELPIYLREQIVPRNTQVLDWWKKNEYRFPVLAYMARRYLNVPASQTSSERLFSTAGNIVTPDRARLLSGHVEQLAFLNKNLD